MVEPAAPPRPWRLCGGCRKPRPFVSSGKIRLNANGRRLDAWLIYRCIACDRTWNRTVAERIAVSSVPDAKLQAMHRSDPDWVRNREFDLAFLRRYSSRIDLDCDLVVKKSPPQAVPWDWSIITLHIEAPWPTVIRLDRLLSNKLPISRSGLRAMERKGSVKIFPVPAASLKKPVLGRITVRFVASMLAEEHRAALAGQSL
ncbi:MAG: DUF1062 domain-containing protein [Rhizobiaceae bacterium]